MNNFIKKTTFLLLLAISITSCNSCENTEETISDEQVISSELNDKIIATAKSTNDYNLLNFDCFSSGQLNSNSSLDGYFLNHKKESSKSFLLSTNDNWTENYQAIKDSIFNTTEIQFSDEDFHIYGFTLIENNNLIRLLTRESYVDLFEDCSFDGTLINNFYTFYTDNFTSNFLNINQINYDCSNNNVSTSYSIIENGNLITSLLDNDNISNGSTVVENKLAIYNNENNTSYTLNNIYFNTLSFTSSNGTDVLLSKKEHILNFLEDCSYERIFEDYDVLNFVYPLQVHRFSLELEEVITYEIETNEDLIEVFSEDIGELTFEYPINLLGQDGTVLVINTNEELETAFNNSLDYVNY